ncbi:hypothetical protein ABK040_016222 [Willaertia magna]
MPPKSSKLRKKVTNGSSTTISKRQQQTSDNEDEEEKKQQRNNKKDKFTTTNKTTSINESNIKASIFQSPKTSVNEMAFERKSSANKQNKYKVINTYFTPSFKFVEYVLPKKEKGKQCFSVDFHSRRLDIFATTHFNSIYIWQFSKNKKLQVIHKILDSGLNSESELYCIKWGVFKGKDILAVGGDRPFVNIYEIQILENEEVKIQMLGHLLGHGNCVNCICFHPDMNGLILTGSSDFSIRLWDLNLNFETVAIFQGHLAGVISLSFHRSGKYFVSGGMDNTCRVYEIDHEVYDYINFKKEYKKLENTISSTNSGNGNGSIKGKSEDVVTSCVFMNEKTSCQLMMRLPILRSKVVFKKHKNYVDSCLFIGDIILSKCARHNDNSTCDPGDSVIAWLPDSVTLEKGFNLNVNGEDEITTIHRFKGESCIYWWLKMSCSDRYLARPKSDGSVELFDLEQVDLQPYSFPFETLIHGDSDIVRECAFSLDSKTLITIQARGCISRWELIEEEDNSSNGNNSREVMSDTNDNNNMMEDDEESTTSSGKVSNKSKGEGKEEDEQEDCLSSDDNEDE